MCIDKGWVKLKQTLTTTAMLRMPDMKIAQDILNRFKPCENRTYSGIRMVQCIVIRLSAFELLCRRNIQISTIFIIQYVFVSKSNIRIRHVQLSFSSIRIDFFRRVFMTLENHIMYAVFVRYKLSLTR